MGKKRRYFRPDEPLRNPDHHRPMTRREFIAQGFMAGSGMVMGLSLFSLLAGTRGAQAALSQDIQDAMTACGFATQGAGKIPFICFDLAGGANIAGSNVLVGGPGGQLDFLSTAGYSKLGLPGDMIPPLLNPVTGTSDFIDTELGLAFHSDSAMLRGIKDKFSAGFRSNVNGAVIPARSDNDTGNNPHNPMYGIYRAGADGSLLTLCGSRNSESGGNSVAPVDLVDLSVRPTKIDRFSDVTGLVDTGKLVSAFSKPDAVAVLESMKRMSDHKLAVVEPKLDLSSSMTDAELKQLMSCSYTKSAFLADNFGVPSDFDPAADTKIIGTDPVFTTPIFTVAEMQNDQEFEKTASVMKLVVNGLAGAGTITMGGYDYHTGDRITGELRDQRAGRCIGACLEYAARVGVPIMIYVFSDGSVASNGQIDNTLSGPGKGVWTGDNSSTAASYFLVYNPAGAPTLLGANATQQAQHQQIGFMRADASVDTGSSPAANNVNLLVQTIVLNYLALHGTQGDFQTLFPTHGLGNAATMDSVTAFAPIVSGTIV